jgi:hypothetical protein
MKMGLFKPKWMDANEIVADIAVRKLTKEVDLINAALKSPHKRVRYYAAGRINNQEALARIAAEDKEYFVSSCAARMLKDQELLVCLATHNNNPGIRRIASEKLTNQAVLKEIAQKDQDNDVRIAAIARLTDEKELIRIVKNDPLRKHAANRLKELAAERGQTLGNMVDQSALMDTIAKSESGWERVSAIMLLEERELLRLIQQDTTRFGDGRIALNQLQDQEALKKIISGSGYNFTQKAQALGRLLQIAPLDSVDIDDELLQHMLKDPLYYSDCLKQIYRTTRKHAEQIKKLNGTHHDHGYRSDGCHEDSHFDLSDGIVFGFD